MENEGSSVGALNEPSAVRSLRCGDVVATYVTDGVMALRPAVFFPQIPDDYWSSDPQLLDGGARVVMSAGGLLIERDSRLLLIDAGVGPMTQDTPLGTFDFGSLLDVLTLLRRRPEDIDTVAFTHLHFDHAGWAFTPDGRFNKVFPNARYVLSAQEWAPHADGGDADSFTTPRRIIDPLRASAHTLIEDGDEVFPGVRAVVTPGHSPGHTSYVITSTCGARLVAFGDAFHIPAQLAHPDWPAAPDIDSAGVLAARQRLLAELTKPDTVGFAFHFGDQPFGRVTTDAAGLPHWEPVPTTVHAPASGTVG